MRCLETGTNPRRGWRKLLCFPLQQAEALFGRGCTALTTTSGPVVVAAVFCLVFLLMGSAYSFSTFATALQRELNADSGSISLIFGCAMALLYAGGLFSGIRSWPDG